MVETIVLDEPIPKRRLGQRLQQVHREDRNIREIDEFLDARFGEIQMLEAPAQLLGRHHLAFAELPLRDAKRLDDDHSVHDAARVHHVAKTRRIFEIPFLRAVDLVLDVLHHRKAKPARREGRAHVTLRGIAGRYDVLF